MQYGFEFFLVFPTFIFNAPRTVGIVLNLVYVQTCTAKNIIFPKIDCVRMWQSCHIESGTTALKSCIMFMKLQNETDHSA